MVPRGHRLLPHAAAGERGGGKGGWGGVSRGGFSVNILQSLARCYSVWLHKGKGERTCVSLLHSCVCGALIVGAEEGESAVQADPASLLCASGVSLSSQVVFKRAVEGEKARELVRKCPVNVFDIEDMGNGE